MKIVMKDNEFGTKARINQVKLRLAGSLGQKQTYAGLGNLALTLILLKNDAAKNNDKAALKDIEAMEKTLIYLYYRTALVSSSKGDQKSTHHRSARVWE